MNDLFGPRPRRPRRVLMHFVDVGAFPDGKQAARFKCSCGADSGWIYATNQQVRRGIPCEACNHDAVAA